MCTFRLMAGVCLFWWHYFKRNAPALEGEMRIHEFQSSVTLVADPDLKLRGEVAFFFLCNFSIFTQNKEC